MDNNVRKRVYDVLLSKTGYKDSFEDFNKFMDTDNGAREKVYEVLRDKTGYKDSFDDFNRFMGGESKEKQSGFVAKQVIDEYDASASNTPVVSPQRRPSLKEQVDNPQFPAMEELPWMNTKDRNDASHYTDAAKKRMETTFKGGGFEPFSHREEDARVNKQYIPKKVEDESDIIENARNRFALTERGGELNEELSNLQKEKTDKYLGEFKKSKEYQDIVSRPVHTPEEAAASNKEINDLFTQRYGEAVDKEMQPYYDAYRDEVFSRYDVDMKGDFTKLGKKNTSNQVADLTKEVNSMLDKQHESLKQHGGSGGNAMNALMGSTQYNQATSEQRGEIGALASAQRLLENSQEIINEAGKKGNTNFVAGLGRGLRDNFDADKWTMGLAEMADAKYLNNALEKSERGEPLTPVEEKLLESSTINMVTQAYFSGDLGRGYKAGQVTAESLPFMMEFIVNPISGSGNVIAKKLLGYGMRHFGRSSSKVARMTLNAFGNALKGKNARIAGRLIGDSAAALGMEGTTGIGRVTAGTFDRLNQNYEQRFDENGQVQVEKTGNMSTGEALVRSGASTFFDNQSEMIFNAFRGGGKAAKEAIGSAVPGASEKTVNKLVDFYNKVRNNKTLKSVTDRAQFHGVLEEYGEEVYNNIANVSIGEMNAEDAISLDNNIDTFLGLAPTSLAFATLGIGGLVTENINAKKRLHRFVENLDEDSRGIFEELWDEIEKGDNDIAKQFVKRTLADKSLSEDARKERVFSVKDMINARDTEQEVGGAENVDEPATVEEAVNEPLVIDKVSVYRDFKRAERKVMQFLPQETKAQLDSGIATEDILKSLDENQSAMASDYLDAKQSYMQYQSDVDNRKQEKEVAARQQAVEDAQAISHKDTGNVIRASMYGNENPVYVIGGTLLFQEDGILDKVNSSEEIIYLGKDGKEDKPLMASPNDFDAILSEISSEDMVEQSVRQAMQLFDEEETASLASPDIPAPERGATVAIGGDTYLIESPDEDIPGNYQAVKLDTNGEIEKQEALGQIKSISLDEYYAAKEAELWPANETMSESVNEKEGNAPSKVLPDGRIAILTGTDGNEVSFDILERSGNVVDSEVMPAADFSILNDFVPSEEESAEEAVASDNMIENESENESSPLDEESKVSEETAGFPKEQMQQQSAPIQAEEQQSTIQQEEQSSMIMKEDGITPDFVSSGEVNTFNYLSDRYKDGGKVYHKVEVTKKAFENDLQKASKTLEKAQTAYDDAPIGRETKAEVALQKAQQTYDSIKKEADFWNSLDAAIKLDAEQPGDKTAEEIRAMGDPMDGHELAAQMLASGQLPLLYADYKRETGFGNNEAKNMFGLFKSKDSGGLSIEEAGERLMLADQEAGTNFFDQNDANAGRNAIIDAISSARTRSGLIDYIKNNRESMAERERHAEEEYQRQQYEAWTEENYHMTPEEYESYKEIISHNPKSNILLDSDYMEFMTNFVDEQKQIENEINRGNEQQRVSGIRKDGGEVLSEEEPVSSERIGGIEEESQRTDGGINSEDGVVSEGTPGRIEEELLSQQEVSVIPESEMRLGEESALIEEGDKVIEDAQQTLNTISEERGKVDANPTDAQKEAGNYKKGHVKVEGYDITLENPKGSERSGTDADGKKWSVTMNSDYGYIRGTEGVDGDHIDVFLSDFPEQGNVFVVDQLNTTTGAFDEHKVMYGFSSMDEATNAYLSNYAPGWQGIGAISEVSKEEFKKWVDSSRRKTKPFVDYKGVRMEDSQSKNSGETAENASKSESIAEKTQRDEDMRFREKDSYTEEQSIVEKAKEDGSFMKAPNGKKTNLTDKQWVQVRTKAFKNWFGDWENSPKNTAKVVDKNGEPLVVYHGTLTKNIDRFRKDMIGSRYSYDESGFFFTDKENIAKDYSTSEFDSTAKGGVIPVFLNMRKPIVVDNKWAVKNGLGNALKNMDSIEFWDNYQSFMLDEIENSKSDGVIINDGFSKMVVVFEPNQIKSATENSGEFSSSNDAIRLRDNSDNLNKSDVEKALSAINSLSEALHTPIRMIRTVEELPDGKAKRTIERGRSVKAWYDLNTGEVSVYLPNINSATDAVKSVLHEVVGHKGLRDLFGAEMYDEMMTELYEQLPADIQKDVSDVADGKYNGNTAVAMDEYLAEQAEKDETPSWWSRVVSSMRDFLREMGVDVTLTANDVKYLLWKSKNRLMKSDNGMDLISKVAVDENMKERFHIGEYARTPEQEKADYDRASKVVSDFAQDHAGAGNTLVIHSRDMMRKQLEAIGMPNEYIDEIENAFNSGEAVAVYNEEVGRVIISNDGASEKELKGYLWHENTHEAIRKLFGDKVEEAINPVYDWLNKRRPDDCLFIRNLYSESAEGVQKEECAVAYFEKMINVHGENKLKEIINDASSLEVKDFFGKIFNYIVYGTEEEGNRENRSLGRGFQTELEMWNSSNARTGEEKEGTESEGARNEAGSGERQESNDKGVRFRESDNSANEQIKELNARIASLEKKISRFENQEELRRSVTEFIRGEIDLSLVGYLGKQDLNSLLVQAQNAKSLKSLEKIVMNVKNVIMNAQRRKLQRIIDKLLSLQVQDVNGKNMSIAKNVDDSTRKIFSFLRGKVSDLALSGFEDDMKYLRRSVREKREEITRLHSLLTTAKTEEEKNSINEQISSFETEVEEGKSKLKDLQAEADAVKEQILNAGDVDIDAEMKRLDEKMDNAAMGKDTWTQGDTERMAALNILQGIFTNRKYDAGIEGIEIDKQKLILNNSDLYKKRIGKNETERKRITEQINENHRRIVAYDRLVNDIRSTQVKQMEMTVEELNELISNGRNNLLRRKEKEMQRKRELIGGAIRSAEGKPIDIFKKNQSKEHWAKKFFSAPMGSFEYMCKRVNTKTLGKDGFLYKRFIAGNEGVLKAYDTYISGMKELRTRLDDRCEEVFGESFEVVSSKSDKVVEKSGVYVTQSENERGKGYGVRYELPLTKGQAMYIYQVWKMNDGRTKLELQGFDEESVAQIADFIGTEYVLFADWVQDELLKDLREKYNAKYLEMFNTSLVEIENYIPLKIRKEAVRQEASLSEDGKKRKTLEERAGSLINRTVNTKPVDITYSGFDVLLEHGSQMEEWNAYARVRKDLDYILSSIMFRNQLNANVRGSYESFYDAAEVATKANHLDSAKYGDEILGKLSKGIVGGNIAFRLNTALKQVLSAPAFLGYSQSPLYIAHLTKNAVKPYADVQWCMKNIPSFYERVKSGTAGNEKLDEKSFSRWMDKYIEIGMIPNKLVDAITCSIGAKSIFDYKFVQLKKSGLKEEEARNQALSEADIYYNATQQSSHPAFMSPMQMSRTFTDRMLTTYQNSNIGYVRKLMAAFYDLSRSLKWQELKKNYTEMYMKEEGLSELEAESKAYRILLNENRKSVVEIALFGWGLNMLWNIGSQGLLGFFRGDGDDDKWAKDLAFMLTSPIKGVPGGNLLESIASGYGMNPFLVYAELDKFMKESKKAIEEDGLISPQMAYITLAKASRYSGVDLEAWGNVYLGVEGLVRDGALEDDGIIDLMYILNSPKSSRVTVAKDLYKNEPILEYAEKIARAYKYIPKKNAWENWVPGAKPLTKRKENEVKKEVERIQMTPEERKDIDIMEKKKKHLRKLKELSNDPEALQKYRERYKEEITP